MPTLRPYPSYKDTDLPWLAQIPAHWDVQRAKFIFKKMSRPIREEDDVITAFRDGTVTLRTNRRTEGFTFSIKEIGYQGIRKGDLVIHQMDGFAGAIGVSDSDGKSTPIYSVCVPTIPASTYFYAYLLREMAKSDFILSLAKGIRERSSDFRFDVFKELELPIPPIKEQQTIATYLDRQTAKIDALIAKKQRLLDLLAEQRAALISQAVTKGLNPNVKMKDSGMAWLGQVPSHWEVKKLKQISKVIFSNVDKNKLENEEPVQLCNYVDVYKNDEITSDIDFMQATATDEEIKKFTLKENDVIITKDSESWTDIAVPAFVPNSLKGVLCGYHLALIRPNTKVIEGEFLFRSLQAKNFRYQFEVEATGITRYGIDQYAINNTLFLVPPIDEQKEIVDYLDHQTKRLSDLAVKIETAIERLREYRAALISSVVTGKVRVSDDG